MTKLRATDLIVNEQINKWNLLRREKKPESKKIEVITISREPGSGGKLVAEKVVQVLGYDLFSQEIVNSMAESSKTRSSVVETLDERGLNMLDEWITSLVEINHLWPDQYLKHLLKVVGTIANHGNAVIVGRGANFIINPEINLRVRIVEPLNNRIEKVAKKYKVSKNDAMKRIKKTEAQRSAFIKKYFYKNIDDLSNYDIVLNMENITIDKAAHIIKCTIE